MFHVQHEIHMKGVVTITIHVDMIYFVTFKISMSFFPSSVFDLWYMYKWNLRLPNFVMQPAESFVNTSYTMQHVQNPVFLIFKNLFLVLQSLSEKPTNGTCFERRRKTTWRHQTSSSGNWSSGSQRSISPPYCLRLCSAQLWYLRVPSSCWLLTFLCQLIWGTRLSKLPEDIFITTQKVRERHSVFY